MIVYRIEKNGYGPFRCAIKNLNNRIFMTDFAYNNPPMYRLNFKNRTGLPYKEIYYGCPSCQDLGLWFDFELLLRYGFSYVEYLVPDGLYEVGKHQCLFIKKASKELKRGCISKLIMV
jgi:hypothetical protein